MTSTELIRYKYKICFDVKTGIHNIYVRPKDPTPIGRLRLYYDDEYENIIISCVLPGFIFLIVVVDDEIEATSRSSRCLQKRNEKDSDM